MFHNDKHSVHSAIMVQTLSHQLILLSNSSSDLQLGQRFENINTNTFSPSLLQNVQFSFQNTSNLHRPGRCQTEILTWNFKYVRSGSVGYNVCPNTLNKCCKIPEYCYWITKNVPSTVYSPLYRCCSIPRNV